MRTYEKLAEKLNLTPQLVEKMIISDHEMFKLSPKSNLESVDVDINPETLKKIKKIATKLKISQDAVICGLLVDYIEKRKNGTKTVRSKTVRRKR